MKSSSRIPPNAVFGVEPPAQRDSPFAVERQSSLALSVASVLLYRLSLFITRQCFAGRALTHNASLCGAIRRFLEPDPPSVAKRTVLSNSAGASYQDTIEQPRPPAGPRSHPLWRMA